LTPLQEDEVDMLIIATLSALSVGIALTLIIGEITSRMLARSMALDAGRFSAT